jgi:threonine dehydratase
MLFLFLFLGVSCLFVAPTTALSTQPTTTLDLPTFNHVLEASQVLNGIAHITPVLTSRTLHQQLGDDISVYFKCENFQRMGAFKFRGGYNALWHLSAEEKKSGVVTFSSGNHAQAVALAARLLGSKATIIMPNDAPPSKVQATQGYGGKVIFYDRYKDDREAIARDLQETQGAVFVPPYDDKYVIAGQGTSCLELFETLKGEHGIDHLDYLFVCVGGGGLISGCALVAHALSPTCKVIGVEPATGNDAQQSLEAGKIIKIDTPSTIADGAQTQYIGKLTFAIMRDKVDRIITVTDDELIEQMRFFGDRMKIVVRMHSTFWIEQLGETNIGFYSLVNIARFPFLSCV